MAAVLTRPPPPGFGQPLPARSTSLIPTTPKHIPRFLPSRRPGAAPPPPVPPPKPPKDVVIDKWVTKIFDIIQDGPTGGFVRYGIDAQNQLYVDRTGNRGDLDEVVADLLPPDACRFLAYSLKHRKSGSRDGSRDDSFMSKMVWFIWVPQTAPHAEASKYIDGLATTLIGLNCPSKIPMISAKSTDELSTDTILAQL